MRKKKNKEKHKRDEENRSNDGKIKKVPKRVVEL